MKTLEPGGRKRLIFYALLCACIGIWGFVLYEVVRGLGQAEDVLEPGISTLTAAPALDETIARPDSGYVYQDDFRDPFTPPADLFPVPRRERGSRAPRPEPAPPPLSLSGIVDKTALLQGEDGSSYVVRAGEQVAGARLLQVHPDHVVLRYEGRPVTLRLPR